MKYLSKPVFKIGFWHPFGVHGKEKPDDIIKRKNNEIRKNGWTLWSFQSRKKETIECWINEIKKHSNRIFVFCSDSKGARDPIGDKFNVKQFKWSMSDKWLDLPPTIKIPHPFGKKTLACSFKVKAIYDPKIIKIPKGIRWFCMRDKKWREDKLPTRGEYLIKTGGNCRLRKICRVLELEPPYLAVIRK